MVNWTDGPTTQDQAPLRADVVLRWLQWVERQQTTVQVEIAEIIEPTEAASDGSTQDDQAA
ncbi:MAG TPA: hypothetical protein VF914_21650 [Chloroflexia bacterium]|jgi:hypothetical protein